jgi:hypothetical protein
MTKNEESYESFEIGNLFNFKRDTPRTPRLALFTRQPPGFHHPDLPAEPPYFDGIYEEIRVKSINESDRVCIINSSLNAI